MGPRAIALAVIRIGAASRAASFVRTPIADFVALYAAPDCRPPTRPAIAAAVTIRACRRSGQPSAHHLPDAQERAERVDARNAVPFGHLGVDGRQFTAYPAHGRDAREAAQHTHRSEGRLDGVESDANRLLPGDVHLDAQVTGPGQFSRDLGARVYGRSATATHNPSVASRCATSRPSPRARPVTMATRGGAAPSRGHQSVIPGRRGSGARHAGRSLRQATTPRRSPRGKRRRSRRQPRTDPGSARRTRRAPWHSRRSRCRRNRR